MRIALILLLSFSYAAFGQLTSFNYKNWAPEDFGSSGQIWSIQEDGRGTMNFATNGGFITYDGENWTKTSISDVAYARSLDKDENGVLWAGGIGDCGYLTSDSLGNYIFHSILDELGFDKEGLRDFWVTKCSSQGVFFCSFNKVIQYDQGKIYVYESEEHFYPLHEHLGNIYVHEKGVGLHMIKDHRLIQLHQFDRLHPTTPYAFIDLGNDTSYVVLEKYMFKILNSDFTDTTLSAEDDALITYYAEVDDYLGNYRAYGACALPDGNIAINTMRRGVVIIDPAGNIQSIFNVSHGLIDNTVFRMHYQEGVGLWLGTNAGISLLEYPSPMQYYRSPALSGSVQDASYFNNSLYIATSQGIFKSAGGKPYDFDSTFIQYPRCVNQSWVIKPDGENLYGGSGKALYQLEPIYNEVIENITVFDLHFSEKFPEWAFIASWNGVLVFNRDDWGFIGHIKIPAEVRSLTTDSEGNLFCGSFSFGLNVISDLQLLDTLTYSILTIEDSVFNQCNVQNVNGDVLVGTVEGLFKFEGSADYDAHSSGSYTLDTSGFIQFTDVLNGTNWFGTSSKQGFVKNNEFNYLQFYNRKFGENRFLRRLDDGKIYAGFADILMVLEEETGLFLNHEYDVIFRKVELNDSVLFHGFWNKDNCFVISQPNDDIPEFQYGDWRLRVEFAANSYNSARAVEYSYRLIGYDTAWSAWSNEPFVTFTNLYEGEYTLEVKALNPYNKESRINKYQFSIIPPWYRTYVAYLCYFLLFLILIILIVKLSVKRLKKANEKLENTVLKRTQEIRQQKDELEEKNKEILDSIQYAKRLQNAILPPRKVVKEYLPESFILYMPKDIVAGDFYWMETVGDTVYFAAADCTGHGVPGAMVSVVCSNALSKALVEEKIMTPAGILDRARELVIDRFGKSEEEVKDGMDISLCALNTKTNEVHWSGANNPLWVIKSGQNEISEIKADKQPIGLYTAAKPFTNHTIQLEKGDSIYLFSDGFPDQFGGEKGKKYKSGKFKKYLLSLQNESMLSQHDLLSKEFDTWKGDIEQIDDVCVIGVKI